MNGIVVVQKVITGMSSLTLLAIPFFVFSGILMNQSGITRRIMNDNQQRQAERENGLSQGFRQLLRSDLLFSQRGVSPLLRDNVVQNHHYHHQQESPEDYESLRGADRADDRLPGPGKRPSQHADGGPDTNTGTFKNIRTRKITMERTAAVLIGAPPFPETAVSEAYKYRPG